MAIFALTFPGPTVGHIKIVYTVAPGLKLSLQSTCPKSMKKKETIWQLLKRLDDQGGQFNPYLAAANRYFDITAAVTLQLIDQHERDMHNFFSRIENALRPL